MRKSISKLASIFSLFLIFSACQKLPEIAENKNAAEMPKTVEIIQPKRSELLQKLPIDAAKLANKTTEEIDEIFGRAIEIKEISQPKKGEYRVYKVADEPKGLAIRFYDGRAKNFNLILSAPVSTSKEALKKNFAIDVGNQPPTKDENEPLSEKWSGNFGGVKFLKVSARRETANKGFVFVLAEIE